MVSPIGIAGLGLGVAGGLAQAAGGRRRGQAFTQTGQASVDAARQMEQRNAAARQFFQPQAEAFEPRRQEALNALISALGPERTQRLADNRTAATGLQQAAAGQIGGGVRPTPNFTQQGAGLSTALAARRAAAARQAPGQQARALGLAQAMLAPEDAAAQSAFADEMQGLGREAQELQAERGLRQALAARAAGIDQQRLIDLMSEAQRAGVGLGALGQFAENVGLGMTHHTAFPQAPATPVNPDPTGEIARSMQLGTLDPRGSLAEINALVPETFNPGPPNPATVGRQLTPAEVDQRVAARMAQVLGGL